MNGKALHILKSSCWWLFKRLVWISALSCVLMIGLWIRSYFVREHVGNVVTNGPAYMIISFKGELVLDYESNWIAGDGVWDREKIPPGLNDAIGGSHGLTCSWFELFGFGFGRGTMYIWPGHLYPDIMPPPPITDPRYWRDKFAALDVPDWAVIAALAFPSVRGLYLKIKRQRLRNSGRCGQCGYDLRATPDICPECGASAQRPHPIVN
jgi:hypothetical protein